MHDEQSRACAAPFKVKIRNFTGDWRDGRAVAALCQAFGGEPAASADPLERAKAGLACAEQMGVPRLLEAEDLCDPDCGDLSVMMYVAMFRKKYPDPPNGSAPVCLTDGCGAEAVVYGDYCEAHTCTCPFVECGEGREPNSAVCAAHKCPVDGCVAALPSQTAAACADHTCRHPTCQAPGTPYCANHQPCQHPSGCDQTAASLTVPLCAQHTCQHPSQTCTQPTAAGLTWCAQHTCTFPGGCANCVESAGTSLCAQHTCQHPEAACCKAVRSAGATLCPPHTCTFPGGCTAPTVWRGGLSAEEQPTACADHLCQHPEAGCLKSVPAAGKTLCAEHQCTHPSGCDEPVVLYLAEPVTTNDSGAGAASGSIAETRLCANHTCKYPLGECREAVAQHGVHFCPQHGCHYTGDGEPCSLAVSASPAGCLFCPQHQCHHDDCAAGLESGSLFCKEHQCQFEHNGGCTNGVSPGARFCTEHMPAGCQYDGCSKDCSYGQIFCPAHTCAKPECQLPIKLPGSRLCAQHACSHPDCIAAPDASIRNARSCKAHLCRFNDCGNAAAHPLLFCPTHGQVDD